MKQLLAITALLFGLGISSHAGAGEAVTNLSPADAQAIHSVVQSQLDALAADDAEGAFELNTPAKQMLIGTADNFLRLIKEEYNPIYRYLRVIFSSPQVVHGNPIQIVRVTDGASHVWLAVFWMEQEDDHSWKIDGCHLLETSSISI